MDAGTLAWALALVNAAFAAVALLVRGAVVIDVRALGGDPWLVQGGARVLQAAAWCLLALAGWHPGSNAVLAVQLLLAAGLAADAGGWMKLAGRAAWSAVAALPLVLAAFAFAGRLGGDTEAAMAWGAPAFIGIMLALRLRPGATELPRQAYMALATGLAAVLLIVVQARALRANGAPLAPALLCYLAWAMAAGLGFLLAALDRREQDAARLATIDPLTDALNRHGFYSALSPWMALSRRPGQPTSVLLLDLDHFKRVNDTYGHAAGDAVLKHVVDTVRRQLRDSDAIGRLGGEQFAVLLPRTGVDEAGIVAERIRDAIEQAPVKTGRALLSVTASFGLTAIAAHDSTATLFQRADSALAQAKQGGRNRVGVAGLIHAA
jgi:diguanylate cyclase (GGDEF)-like protein